MAENTVKGRKYRILSDAINQIWDRVSFWTHADDLEFSDGQNASTKVGAINGITDDLSSEDSSIAASSVAVKTLNDSLGGCEFSVESDGAYVTYNVGADTVRKKLGSGGKLYKLGSGRSFNIATIVGSENVGKYTKDNFIVTSGGFSTSATNTTPNNSGARDATGTVSVVAPTVSYNNINGSVTITGGTYSLSVSAKEATTGTSSGNMSVTVYFVDTEEIVNVS